MPPRAEKMVSREELGYEQQQPHRPQKLGVQVNRGLDHQTYHGSTTKTAFTTTTSSPNNSSSNSNSKSRRRRRHVDFSTDTITNEVEHLDDLPGELIWYSKEEYDAIKARNSQIVKFIKAGEFEENDDYSCRGLEHKLKEIFRQRRANKFNALNAVLEEQDRQINRGLADPALISAAYQVVSVRCHESAHTIACRDYRFSLNYCPTKPATGHHRHNHTSGSSKPKKKEKKGDMGDNSAPAATAPTSKGDKKKKKKDKKDREKVDKEKKDKKDRDKDRDVDKDKEKEKNHDELEDPDLSPKKKGKVRKIAKGARRMYRRMSM